DDVIRPTVTGGNRSAGLDDLAGLDAARADVDALRRALDQCTHPLDVGVPATLRAAVRVRHRHAPRRALATHFTYRCHLTASPATRRNCGLRWGGCAHPSTRPEHASGDAGNSLPVAVRSGGPDGAHWWAGEGTGLRRRAPRTGGPWPACRG